MSRFHAGLDGITLTSQGAKLLGGLYQAAGEAPRPTAVLLHGLPGIEKHLDIAYALRDLGWNCLYFHFRGCWGSAGAYTLAGLADDTHAALAWLRRQECVDPQRLVLIGASSGSYPAFLCGAADPTVRAIVAISPVVEPRAFRFPPEMAASFADMLVGVTGEALIHQWSQLASLVEPIRTFGPRPVLFVTAGKDSIFPGTDYTSAIASYSHVDRADEPNSDHGFSTTRPWLVRTVTAWLVATLGT
jgi:pimeloyl-ACP methyl ester carboxylesterase